MSATAGREHKRSDGRLPVIELFGPTIQGEGRLCGSVSHFIRFGGCDFRCSWCDSMHAVDPDQVKQNAKWLSPAEIHTEIQRLPFSNIITFSGGNPALWDLNILIDLLMPKHFLAVETQGSIWQDWMEKVDLITVSPKGPSSGMYSQLDWGLLKRFDDLDSTLEIKNKRCTDVVFKVVVFSEVDYEFAQDIRGRFPLIQMYLSAGTPLNCEPGQLIEKILMSYRVLCERVLCDDTMQSVVVLPQMHQLLWPGQQGK
jgi:7-carboxy-7-deazaguanine synthase